MTILRSSDGETRQVFLAICYPGPSSMGQSTGILGTFGCGTGRPTLRQNGRDGENLQIQKANMRKLITIA